jgi:CLIP-associating protein 1/2
MVVPTLTGLREPNVPNVPMTIESSDDEIVTPLKSMKVYEDPFSSTDDQTTPRPAVTASVLGEVRVNEDASNLTGKGMNGADNDKVAPVSPERFKQNSRLLDSGIAKIKAKSLDVHGFRKLQGLIRDHKASWSDDKFDSLLLGLFEYLEAPLTSLSPEKVNDVKAQILATIKLMYKKDPEAFRPHVTKGLESILSTRSTYEARTHIVAGLELLTADLITLADPKQTTDIITPRLQKEEMTLEGMRSLSMGLHVLRELLDSKKEFVLDDGGVEQLCNLATRALKSPESNVRLDAVQLCVAIHAKAGENKFWDSLGDVKGDPKNLITYYIVRRQREEAAGGA